VNDVLEIIVTIFSGLAAIILLFIAGGIVYEVTKGIFEDIGNRRANRK
jgi:hypothetical protein